MSANDKIFYQEKFLKQSGLLLLLYLAVLFLLVYFCVLDILFVGFITIILFVLIVVPSNRVWSFSVHEDKIELLNTFTSHSNGVIGLDQIRQVRFESSFFDGSILYSYIFIYPQGDMPLDSYKKERIALTITGFNRKARILKLLQFFQSKGLDVVIKTDSKMIKEGTGLRDWDRS